jgi:hypothetical protein
MTRLRDARDLSSGLALLALGAYVVARARQWDYMTRDGPGAGFFPLWYGVAMVALSGFLVATSVLRGRAASTPASGGRDSAGAGVSSSLSLAELGVSGAKAPDDNVGEARGSSRQRAAPPGAAEGRGEGAPLSHREWPRVRRALTAWLAVTASVAASRLLGFVVSFALLTFFFVAVMYRRPLAVAALVAVASALGFYLVFPLALGVDLPLGALGF